MPKIYRLLSSGHAEGRLPTRFYGFGVHEPSAGDRKVWFLEAGGDDPEFTYEDLQPDQCLPDGSLRAANGRVWRAHLPGSPPGGQETGRED